MGAFFKKALARETRCRWPPERPSPISPIMREYPSPVSLIKLSTADMRPASSTSASEASGRPMRILSATEPRNRTGYWETSAMWERSSFLLISLTSMPSTFTLPERTS